MSKTFLTNSDINEKKRQLAWVQQQTRPALRKLLQENNLSTSQGIRNKRKLAEIFAERRLWLGLTRPDFIQEISK
tara:strand:+ start:354 stop:578 length:225 start_codon:yes stop_codon:yes gene_type:complete